MATAETDQEVVKLGAAIARLTDPRKGIAPYLASIFEMLVRTEDNNLEMPTLAVTADGRMLWSREFVAKTRVAVLQWACYHEALHILYDHFDRAKGMIPRLANYAQDASINEILQDAAKQHNVELPADWLYPETLEQPRGLIFEERYYLLKKNAKIVKGSGGLGSGKCGSCAGGHAVGGEGKTQGKGRSVADLNRARRTVAEQIQSAAARGNVPAGLARWAEGVLAPAKVDWRTQLLQEIRDAVMRQAGHSDLTFLRPSRRQAGVGWGPRSPILPGYYSPIPQVAVIVDTSGSMGDDVLRNCLSEVQGVCETTTAQVSLLCVDADLQGVSEISRAEEAMDKLKGGGGTDMRPGFEALAKRDTKPDVVIVLTDGHIGDGHPSVQPAWTTIWVTIGEHQSDSRPCPWGTWIAVKETAEEKAA